MRAPKQKLRITVVPPKAPPAGVSANNVALLLACLIGRKIAREQAALAAVQKPDLPPARSPST
ncbi:hypothetical protein [Komagataeibacter oboediens]|uniref:hypothetical protein n=1 Tax=Komagataeibacter oboediens TaxID=65958 RepID=UPI00200FC28C|nr:hypothetical protein [Komagataeibacter oboediens]MCK9821595.1 hypothetical protein [Komagataeibacter oboediens]